MPSQHNPTPVPPSLRGLQPASLAGVLGGGNAPERPTVPGWAIEGIAGQGGFGIVWRAVRETDGIAGAIKIAGVSDLETIERIEEEAAALRALDHPNIVRLLETGALPDGGLFLAMEFVNGSSLAHRIPPRGMDADRALAIFHQIAAAVDHAHARGILHRDLKPQNILISEDGIAKVADFGLARPTHERTHRLSVTVTGVVAGTAEYLPPEAYYAGYRPGTGTDIYALGVVLHDLLTGAPPRGAWGSISERKRVDIRIDDVIRRALAPDLCDRWPTVGSMVSALRKIEASPPRYAGAPRLTFPIRVADAVWTVLSLFICIAALGVMLKTSHARVAWPVDLVGPHGLRAGGFQALAVLLILMAVPAVWQIARLIRFRAVPLRESLPSPFGIRLPPTRTTAGLIFVTQIVCVLIPILCLIDVWFNVCNDWLKPGDPPWRHGLAVTELERTEILSPWSAPVRGKDYRLVERTGIPSDALGRQIDRITFIPGYTPWVMAISAAILGATLFCTGATAAIRWWPHRRARAVGFLSGVSVLGAWALWPSPPEPPPTPQQQHLRAHERWRDERLHYTASSDEIFRTLYPGPAPDWEEFPARLLAHYGPEVDFLSRGRSLLSEVAAELRAEGITARAARQTTELLGIDNRPVRNPADPRFENVATVLRFTDPPDGPATGTWIHRTHIGTVNPGSGITITAERITREALYSVTPRTLTRDEATEWARALVGALARDADPAALPELLNTRVVQTNNGWRSDLTEQRLHDRAAFATAIRAEASRGMPPVLSAPPEIIGGRPGALQRIVVSLRDENTTFEWTVDLIFSESRWLAVRIIF